MYLLLVLENLLIRLDALCSGDALLHRTDLLLADELKLVAAAFIVDVDLVRPVLRGRGRRGG